jgi:acyl-CoA thioester hydrolase
MTARQPDRREDYLHFSRITTRWNDNDVYGHVNNVVYYSYFDTVVNKFLIDGHSLDVENSDIVGLVVETQCQYFRPITFPDTVDAGIRVVKLGTSSARYEVGLFRNDDETAAAQGYFVHVYVDRATNKPVPIPDGTRTLLSTLVRGTPD